MRLDVLDGEHAHDEDGVLWVRTHYGWRMTGRPDPKQGPRIVDPVALSRARLTGEQCAACAKQPANVHHVVQRGSPYFGDDVPGNLLLLCGSGTMGCHGAWHGSPYEPEWIERERTAAGGWTLAALAAHGIGWPPPEGWRKAQRHDAEWVARRVGRYIELRRRDVIEYVFGKLGVEPGMEFLARNYYLEVIPA